MIGSCRQNVADVARRDGRQGIREEQTNSGSDILPGLAPFHNVLFADDDVRKGIQINFAYLFNF